MKKIKKIIVYVVIIALSLAFARFVLFADRVGTSQVRTIDVEKRVIKKTISALGEVKAEEESVLSFTTGGALSFINVAEEDEILAGTFIASLSSPEGEHNIQAARDARDIALREKELFVEKYEDDTDLVGGDDQYDIQLRVYNEQISRAEANYQATIKSTDRNYLNSPTSGKVVEVYKSRGENVSPGEPLVKIVSGEKLFEITVDQEDYGKLELGQEAEVSLDAYSNTKFSGTIVELPTYARGGPNPTFQVKIQLEDPENKVLLGMTGNARVTVASTDAEVPAVLYDVIQEDYSGTSFVWAINDKNLIQKVPVEIGLEGDLYTELKSDINFTIVQPTSNNNGLEEGNKPKVINE
jgi:RND family efflux transporter MFP subunit